MVRERARARVRSKTDARASLTWVFLLMAGEGDPLTTRLSPRPGSGRNDEARGEALDVPVQLQGPNRDFFLRQLRDIKISIRVETFGGPEMDLYASWCGRALALSHARSGSSITLSGYMGKSDTFDRAIADFSVAYADQNEKDHSALERAVRKGKLKAVFEETR